MSEKLVIPTVHLNGTSRKDLVQALADAHGAVNEAVRKLVQTAPHGRDYYPQGDEVIYAATDQHLARLGKLQDVRRELELIAEALYE